MKLKFLKKAERPAPAALRTAEALPMGAAADTAPAATAGGFKGARNMRCRTFFQGGATEEKAAEADDRVNAFLATHSVLCVQFERAGGRLVCRVLYRE